MRTITPGWRRMLFGVAVAGTLGFGASQAVAAPKEQERRAVCGSCQGRCQHGGDYDRHGHCICCEY
jgi:hypothetical protein